ncbi:MAG TPA: RHS repeat-associated core domain-containing protein [Polyangiaceae bacterium]|nr:RHS repeat-associated core domain-containing protein [Polyangiaceae bacterium]
MCRPLSSGNRSFNYDALGNRTGTVTGGQAAKLSWSGGLLRSVELPDGNRVDYAYDAIGRRVRKTSGDIKISYLWAGNQLIQEVHQSNGQTRTVDYLYLPGTFQPLAKCEGDRVYYYHCDQLGTPQHVTDSSAKLAWSARYSAFGEAAVDVDGVSQPLRFAGQYWDPETGFHYNRARYYDPRLGAYLSRDPLSPHGSNGYLYAQGDPINGSDPLGLFWEDAPGWVKTTATIAAGLAVGIAIGAAVIAAAPLLGVAAGVAGVVAVIAGGIAGGAAAGGLDAAMTEGGCVWCGIGKGAIIGGLAALPFAFLPASAGYLAFAGVGAVSGAIGYFADLGLNGGDFSWGGLGGSMLLGAGFGVAGKFISGLIGGKQAGARGRGGKGGKSETGGTTAKDAAKARAGAKGTSRNQDDMAGSAKNTAVEGEPSVATNKEATNADRSKMTKLMRDRIEAQDQVIKTNRRLIEEGKTTEQINRMSDAEMRAELAKDGVPPDVQRMDTADQLRRTNNRVKMREDQMGGPMKESDWTGLHDENGKHGEVKAIDDELQKIEKAKGREATPQDLEDIELHNTRVPKKDSPVSDEAMPRCDHCRGLTKGVKTTPELEHAEHAVDRQARQRFPDDNRTPFGPSTPQGRTDGGEGEIGNGSEGEGGGTGSRSDGAEGAGGGSNSGN